MSAKWMYYWDLVPRELCDRLFGKGTSCPGHAGDFETSTALFTHPELVDLKAYERFKETPGPRIKEAKEYASHFKLSNVVATGLALYNASMNVTELISSGVLPEGGSPMSANARKGKEAMDAAVEGLASLIRDMFKEGIGR